MSKDVDTIQFRNEDGEYVYAKTHLDAIDGMEDYAEGITQLASLIGSIVYDSGWIPYSINTNIDNNIMYSGEGYECSFREVGVGHPNFGNKNLIVFKSIRVNTRNFAHEQQVGQLPTGFMKNAQIFWARGGNGYQPIMVEIRKDGRIIPRIMVEDVNKPNKNNWIYGQFSWLE